MSENQNNSGQGAHDIIIDDNVLGEFKDNPALQNLKGQNIGKLFKGLDNAHKLTAGKVPLPHGKLDTPENWEKVYDALGRPKDPGSYQFRKAELPPGWRHDNALEQAFRAEAHRLGLSTKQAGALHDYFLNQVQGAFDEMEAERDRAYGEAHAAIHEVFGNETDLALRLANRMLHTFGGSPEEVQYIADNYGNDPKLVALLARVGMQTREDTLVKGEKHDRFDNRGSAASLKKAILYDKNHPLHDAYTDKKHPYHDEAVQRMLELNTLLHGIQEED